MVSARARPDRTGPMVMSFRRRRCIHGGPFVVVAILPRRSPRPRPLRPPTERCSFSGTGRVAPRVVRVFAGQRRFLDGPPPRPPAAGPPSAAAPPAGGRTGPWGGAFWAWALWVWVPGPCAGCAGPAGRECSEGACETGALHRVFVRPVLRRLVVFLEVLTQDLCDLGHERIVRVRVRQQRANRQQYL